MPAGTYTVRVIVNGLYIPLYQYVSLSYAVLQVNRIWRKNFDSVKQLNYLIRFLQHLHLQ